MREARLHGARHTAATVLPVLGISQRAVMGLMRWSNNAMTTRYQHLTPDLRRDIAEQVGKARMADPNVTLTAAAVPARVVEHDEDLLSQIEEIYVKGYVFVRGPDRKTITGIITAADLTAQFGALARPFVLVEEAERRLRRRVDEVFDIAEIRRVAPRRPERRSPANRVSKRWISRSLSG